MHKRLIDALAAWSLVLVATSVSAQSYWLDGNGLPIKTSDATCLRSSYGSALNLHLACDVPAGKVVLLPDPDGKVGAIIVHSQHAEQLLNNSYASASVFRDGAIAVSAENAAEVQKRYGAVLQAQPQRPVSFVVYFSSGSSADLTEESRNTISLLKASLQSRAAPEITVIGHTDSVGSQDSNDKLSLQRAETVMHILVATGVSAKMIDMAGRGEREPLIPSADGVEEPRNRRVEINIR